MITHLVQQKQEPEIVGCLFLQVRRFIQVRGFPSRRACQYSEPWPSCKMQGGAPVLADRFVELAVTLDTLWDACCKACGLGSFRLVCKALAMQAYACVTQVAPLVMPTKVLDIGLPDASQLAAVHGRFKGLRKLSILVRESRSHRKFTGWPNTTRAEWKHTISERLTRYILAASRAQHLQWITQCHIKFDSDVPFTASAFSLLLASLPSLTALEIEQYQYMFMPEVMLVMRESGLLEAVYVHLPRLQRFSYQGCAMFLWQDAVTEFDKWGVSPDAGPLLAPGHAPAVPYLTALTHLTLPLDMATRALLLLAHAPNVRELVIGAGRDLDSREEQHIIEYLAPLAEAAAAGSRCTTLRCLTFGTAVWLTPWALKCLFDFLPSLEQLRTTQGSRGDKDWDWDDDCCMVLCIGPARVVEGGPSQHLSTAEARRVWQRFCAVTVQQGPVHIAVQDVGMAVDIMATPMPAERQVALSLQCQLSSFRSDAIMMRLLQGACAGAEEEAHAAATTNACMQLLASSPWQQVGSVARMLPGLSALHVFIRDQQQGGDEPPAAPPMLLLLHVLAHTVGLAQCIAQSARLAQGHGAGSVRERSLLELGCWR